MVYRGKMFSLSFLYGREMKKSYLTYKEILKFDNRQKGTHLNERNHSFPFNHLLKIPFFAS